MHYFSSFAFISRLDLLPSSLFLYLYHEIVEKAIFNSSPKNLFLIFRGGWVRVKLIIHVRCTSKVRRTLWLNLFQHPNHIYLM